MYTRFFGLNEKPFSLAPDPRYLFMSERHTEALAHLIYGVRESGGFIQLTGEVGTGKTTLVRSLLQQVPDTADVALILNPQISRNEFLSAICDELGVPLSGRAHSIKDLTNELNAYLLKNHSAGQSTILIVDEAQNLRIDVLEQIRLLTNLETTRQKLLQIILIGQPELREILARTELRQLAQRITGRYHLEPLSRDETQTYIDHRLKVAGAVGQTFSNAAKTELFRLSKGVPRMINVIADRAMLGAFTEESQVVTPKLLRRAASEVFDSKFPRYGPLFERLKNIGTAAVLGAALVGAGWFFANRPDPRSGADAIFLQEPGLSALRPAAGGQATDDMPAPAPAEIPDVTDVPPQSPPALPLETILAEQANATGSDNAFATLFDLWGLDYEQQSARACEQAQGGGLQCLFQRGSLAQVRNLDRPVILSLRDETSRQHQVVLSGLDDTQALLSIGTDTYAVSLNQLSRFWFGDYLLLWRPQLGRAKQFAPGMRDQDVKWLRESLAMIQGEPVAPMDSELFDQNLETRVRDYQRQRRLTVDGLVGYRTQIAINTDLDLAGGPRLAQAN
ncbi:MAG: AAA family ATPase [Gammaproteobacteria bacterium]